MAAVAQFSAEEQRMMDRLRDKYQNFKGGVPEDPNAPEAADFSTCTSCRTDAQQVTVRTGSNVEARMCPHCQGSGAIVEIYNHRRLEKYCTHCEGRGVTVYKDGKEVTQPSTSVTATSTSTAAASSNGQQQQQRQQQPGAASVVSTPAWAQDVGQRIEKLSADLKAIDARMAAYEKEREELRLQANTPACLADPQRASLVAEVAAQVEVQLSRLGALRAKKAALLDRYRNPATIDDIIANEGREGASADGDGATLGDALD